MCNDHCYPGSCRKKKEGEKFCCSGCMPCSEGQISEEIESGHMVKNYHLKAPREEKSPQAIVLNRAALNANSKAREMTTVPLTRACRLIIEGKNKFSSDKIIGEKELSSRIM
ncbi:hypothetical protein L345_15087, partial [Ophiophagus hannah]